MAASAELRLLPLSEARTNMDDMAGTSDQSARKRRTARERTALWKRIGAFVRVRREELGLSQGDIIQALGYKSRNAVSNIEVGIEGLPAKRAYAWADILRCRATRSSGSSPARPSASSSPRRSRGRTARGATEAPKDIKGRNPSKERS